jgi:hypothetical protein
MRLAAKGDRHSEAKFRQMAGSEREEA